MKLVITVQNLSRQLNVLTSFGSFCCPDLYVGAITRYLFN